MAKAKFTFVKHQGRLHLYGDSTKRLYAAWVDGTNEGQLLDAEFKKYRPPKTLAQLGYWFGVLLPFAAQELRDAGHNTLFDVAVGKFKTGVATTPDTVDLLFKTLFAAHKQLSSVPLKRSMNDAEMSALIDFSVMWLATNLGVTAPQPTKEFADE